MVSHRERILRTPPLIFKENVWGKKSSWILILDNFWLFWKRIIRQSRKQFEIWHLKYCYKTVSLIKLQCHNSKKISWPHSRPKNQKWMSMTARFYLIFGFINKIRVNIKWCHRTFPNLLIPPFDPSAPQRKVTVFTFGYFRLHMVRGTNSLIKF